MPSGALLNKPNDQVRLNDRVVGLVLAMTTRAPRVGGAHFERTPSSLHARRALARGADVDAQREMIERVSRKNTRRALVINAINQFKHRRQPRQAWRRLSAALAL